MRHSKHLTRFEIADNRAAHKKKFPKVLALRERKSNLMVIYRRIQPCNQDWSQTLEN
jgi:hypothetical protein